MFSSVLPATSSPRAAPTPARAVAPPAAAPTVSFAWDTSSLRDIAQRPSAPQRPTRGKDLEDCPEARRPPPAVECPPREAGSTTPGERSGGCLCTQRLAMLAARGPTIPRLPPGLEPQSASEKHSRDSSRMIERPRASLDLVKSASHSRVPFNSGAFGGLALPLRPRVGKKVHWAGVARIGVRQ